VEPLFYPGNSAHFRSVQVQTAMNVFYKANVKDGLFNDVWFMKDGTPTGGKSSPVTILTTIF